MKAFQDNGWMWITLQELGTGVPFFAYDEGHDKGEDCAALSANKYYKIMDDNCETRR